MNGQLELGGVVVDVVLKDIKNVHLSVHPPNGRVRISAPERMSLDTLHLFAVGKLDWIQKQQARLREQERETLREYVDRESHFVWGRRRLLSVVEQERAPSVTIDHGRMVLSIRPGTTPAGREAAVAKWYRNQVKAAAPPLVAEWTPILGVTVAGLFVQKMRTKWGSCNPIAHTIRLNTELAKKPNDCLEYILLHEMVHLLEPTHNSRFSTLMDNFMPLWRDARERLNRLPVRHDDWNY